MNKEEEKIVITSWPYKNHDSKFPLNMVIKDHALSDAILSYWKDELELKGQRVYVHKWNIIAVDKCFYGAFYEKDLEQSK